MSDEHDTPRSHGAWKLVSESKLFVDVKCQCGTTRTIRKSTWLAGTHISQRCRRCLIAEAELIHAWVFGKKARVPHGQPSGEMASERLA